MISFPDSISLTITNYCNLRCKMCGQWSEHGYVRQNKETLKHEMSLNDWKRVVDELALHGVRSLLLRGGEVFLVPGIIELLEYIHEQAMFISIDTNGTLLSQFAGDIVRIGGIHMTISVDGTEAVHDSIRGMPGAFRRIKEGLAVLNGLDAPGRARISRSICFTISQYNYHVLGSMPDVARQLGIGSIAIVPYYYFPAAVGRLYDEELCNLGCHAYSWEGFHHENSGVDIPEFQHQYQLYKANLGEILDYPYMALDEHQYRDWFTNAQIPVGSLHCSNIEKLIDIQPDGSANFCVDFVDYSFGNVKEASVERLWNNEQAERFRQTRREKPLAVCYRCGAKFMSRPWNDYG
jgi:MoaA/NifB/PqqE/SkfB family radical SAM enzyme